MKAYCFFLCYLCVTVCCGYPGEKIEVKDPSPGPILMEIFIEREAIFLDETVYPEILCLASDGKMVPCPCEVVWNCTGSLTCEKDGEVRGDSAGEGTLTGHCKDLTAEKTVKVVRKPDFTSLNLYAVNYDIPGSDRGLEFFSVKNYGDRQCPLKGVIICDGNTNGDCYEFSDDTSIDPGEEIVVSDDSKMLFNTYGIYSAFEGLPFTLNNSGETLLLLSPEGDLLDEVYIEGGSKDLPAPEKWCPGNELEAEQGTFLVRKEGGGAGCDAWKSTPLQ